MIQNLLLLFFILIVSLSGCKTLFIFAQNNKSGLSILLPNRKLNKTNGIGEDYLLGNFDKEKHPNFNLFFFWVSIYFLISLITGFTTFGLFGTTVEGVLVYLIISILIIIGIIDYIEFVIPNELLIIISIPICLFLFTSGIDVIDACLNGFISFFILLLVKLVVERIKKKESVGFGDLKLIFLLSLIMPIESSLIAFWLSAWMALIIMLFQHGWRLSKRVEIKSPFGLYLSAGYTIVLFFNKYFGEYSLINFWFSLWE